MTREKFFKIYANLPEPEREQIIVIIEGKPYTWNRAYDEINGETKRGQEILDKLTRMEIL